VLLRLRLKPRQLFKNIHKSCACPNLNFGQILGQFTQPEVRPVLTIKTHAQNKKLAKSQKANANSQCNHLLLPTPKQISNRTECPSNREAEAQEIWQVLSQTAPVQRIISVMKLNVNRRAGNPSQREFPINSLQNSTLRADFRQIIHQSVLR